MRNLPSPERVEQVRKIVSARRSQTVDEVCAALGVLPADVSRAEDMHRKLREMRFPGV